MEYPPRSELIIVDKWSIGQGEREGMPLFIRFRQSLRHLAGHPEFPRRLSINWNLRAADSSGLPSQSDKKELGYFEDNLFVALESDVQAIIVAVVTHNGTREWILHTCNAHETGTRIAIGFRVVLARRLNK